MSIKTILLHLATDEMRRERLAVACHLAQRHGAHLQILFMTSASSMPAAIVGRGASAAYLAEARSIAEGKQKDVEAEVAESCARTATPYTFIAEHGDHNKLLAEHSHYADLLIVHQDHGVAFHDHVGLHGHDELLTMTTCATLVLPHSHKESEVGKHVMIAWKDTREATRAIRDSIVFLEQADKVTVLTCERGHKGKNHPDELLEYLDRHGVKADALAKMDQANIGETILKTAEDIGADCICMGAYGHSRLTEAVFGGVTRNILRHADIPLLMSH